MKIKICCLEKYLEISGMKDVLAEKKIVGPNVVNSVVEGSYDQLKGKSALNLIAAVLHKLPIVAILKHSDTEDLKEQRNKKISLENSSDIRNHMCNMERIDD